MQSVARSTTPLKVHIHVKNDRSYIVILIKIQKPYDETLVFL